MTTHLQTENDGYLKPLRRVKTMRGDVESVISAFKRGNPVLVFDSAFREQETDLLFPAVCRSGKYEATPSRLRGIAFLGHR